MNSPTVFILTILFCSVALSACSGEFEVIFIHFSSPAGAFNFNGGYCDKSGGLCDTYLRICVDSPIPLTMERCSGHVRKTTPKRRLNSFAMHVVVNKTFSGLKEPFGAVVRAWDDDGGRSNDDFIDEFLISFTNKPSVDGIIPDWTFGSAKGRRQKNPCTLEYQYRIYCEPNYYGTGCDSQIIKGKFPQNSFTSVVGTNPLIPVLGTLIPVLLIIMITISILTLLVRRHRRNTTLMLSPSVLSQDQNDNYELEGIRNERMNEQEFLDDAVYLLLMGIDRDWQVSRDRLTVLDQRLGSGCFGHVDKGIYTRKDNKEMFVAVKTLKDPDVQTHRDDFLAELDMLKLVGRHPNVISLVGACTLDDPLCIIIEFIEGGSLDELLIKARLPENRENPYENIWSRLTERDLVKMAAGIARGMKHLHDKNCIHRDLAARNILIAPGLVAKISDFGFARHVTDGVYVKQSPGAIPWKWMAPEALQGIFTTKTDVWSYGILLWEIATLGGTPYPTINQVVALYNLLSNGYRMPKPDHCHDMLYSIMMDCWSAYTIRRPEFAEICLMLQKLLNQKERIYINLEEMEEEQLEHML